MPMIFDESPIFTGLQSGSDTVNSQIAQVHQMYRVQLAGEMAKREIESEDAFARGMATWASDYAGADETDPNFREKYGQAGGQIGPSQPDIARFQPKSRAQKEREWAAIASRIKDPQLAIAWARMRQQELEEEEVAERQRSFANQLGTLDETVMPPEVRESLGQLAEGDIDAAERAYHKWSVAEAQRRSAITRRESALQSADQFAMSSLSPGGQDQYAVAREMFANGGLTPTAFDRRIASIHDADMRNRRRYESVMQRHWETIGEIEGDALLDEEERAAAIRAQELTTQRILDGHPSAMGEGSLGDLDTDPFDDETPWGQAAAGLDVEGAIEQADAAVERKRGGAEALKEEAAYSRNWTQLSPERQAAFVRKAQADLVDMDSEQIEAYFKKNKVNPPDDVLMQIIGAEGGLAGRQQLHLGEGDAAQGRQVQDTTQANNELAKQRRIDRALEKERRRAMGGIE